MPEENEMLEKKEYKKDSTVFGNLSDFFKADNFIISLESGWK
jgi:hypothetical protein